MNGIQSRPTELVSTTVVRFQDCDPYQHLNNARYIDYMLNAWDDQLIKFYDFSVFEHIRANNAGWVVTKTQIAYLHPAVTGEEIVLKTRLLQMTESGLVIEVMIFDREQKRAKSLAWMEFVYVSLITGQRAKHSDELIQVFKPTGEEEYDAHGFEQRVESVRSYYRHRATEAAA